MVSKKINENTNYYPIVLVSDELSNFLNDKISSELILTYLNEKIPEFDPSIKTTIHREFFERNYNGDINDNSKAIEEFTNRFPNYKISNKFSFLKSTTYSATYRVNESEYFSNKNNYGHYYIGNHILPDKPLDYYEVTKEYKDWGCTFQLVIISSIILLIIYNLNYFIFILAFFSTITFFAFKVLPNMKNSKVEKIKKNSLQHKNELKEFKEKIEKIRSNIKEEFIKEQLISTKIAEEKRSIIEPKIISDKLKPVVYTTKKMNNDFRGKCELFFLTKLYDSFNSQIQVDLIPNIGKNPFQPDFVLICNETGFHIDIEIDEPYSINNGKPIHHDRSNDDERNTFFLDINWGVIRFSEKQVIENTKECIELIQNLLLTIKNKEYTFNHNVPLIRKWTYEEALIMSNNGYRNTYLPENMKIKVNYSQNNNSFEFGDLTF